MADFEDKGTENIIWCSTNYWCTDRIWCGPTTGLNDQSGSAATFSDRSANGTNFNDR